MTFTSRRLHDAPARRRFPWRKVFTYGAAFWLTYWRKTKEDKRKRRWGLILGTSIACVVLLVGGVKALVAVNLLNVRSVAGIAGAPLPQDKYGHTNLLLLGQGDASHDGVDLTDTIMIASLDPNTESAVLLSVPRDLYVLRTEKMGRGRINALYRDYKYYLIGRDDLSEEEAGQLAMRELADEIGKALGLELHHVIKVDFIGFVKAVDAIGGVEIDVPYDIVDREYPGPNYSYQTFAIQAGRQLLDGETALQYARTRHTTSDFSRSERQQQLLKEMGRKVRDDGLFSHPGRILELLGILQDHVMTTLTTREMVTLGRLGGDIDPANILSMQLNTENGLYGYATAPGGFLYFPPREDFGGASVILPVSIPPFPVTWAQLRTLTRFFIDDRTLHLARPRLAVLNAGAPSGSSRVLGSEFIRYGLDVETMENAETESETSFVEAEEDLEDTAILVGELLGLEVRLFPSVASSAQSAGPITIVLGKDYVYSPFQTLLLSDDASSETGMAYPSPPPPALTSSGSFTLSSVEGSSSSQSSL